VSLARSFAFRLGAAFAVVAIAAATVTALVVNAAFAARFNRYLAAQQHAQLTQITTAASHAYAGGGKWDLHALEGLVPDVGPGTLRVITPSGKNVWQWDGHQMSWDNRWMQQAPAHYNHHATGNKPKSGGNGSGRGSAGHGGCGSWDNCGTWNNGGSQNSSSWDSGSWNSGWTGSAPGPATAQPATVLAAATAPAPSPAASPAALGTVQRIPITVNGKVVGTALVRVPQASALPDAVAFRTEVIALVLAGGAAGALVSLALGIFFARRAARPVRDLTRAAQAVAAGDRHARLDTGRADEFGQMSQAVNALADTAEGEEKLRQGFAAEVAHELRTPLTILRSQVEGLRVGVLQPDAAALASLQEEIQRMTRLVADLQILGSADAAAFSLERTQADLGTLADQTAREFAALFEGAGIRLQTRLEPATAWADPVRVGQILANLLSNALKYTPQGGLVRLEVTPDLPWAIIRVSDTGPGIPPDELPHIFDRFFRGRAARPAGTGIGLTVVAELARAHGGTAEAASQPGQGTTFTIRLPAQSQTPAQPLPHRSFTPAA
jgi:two-component system sensor histidine kinase BaeS